MYCLAYRAVFLALPGWAADLAAKDHVVSYKEDFIVRRFAERQ